MNHRVGTVSSFYEAIRYPSRLIWSGMILCLLWNTCDASLYAQQIRPDPFKIIREKNGAATLHSPTAWMEEDAPPDIARNESGRTFQPDTLRHPGKEQRKEKRQDFRKNEDQFHINLGSVYARLDTKVSFESPLGILSVNLGLENNLGLPDVRTFLTGSLVYRITPRSGIYTQYYGINRVETRATDRDYIFLEDTIPAGTRSRAYFNTQVISTGYLLTVKESPDFFLGAYLNVYFMVLNTGISSDIGDINAGFNFLAPLPNLGITASFDLKKWLIMEGNIGFFSLYTPDFGGNLYDLSIRLLFKPVPWVGLYLSYQEFDVRVFFPEGKINTIVEYNFRGPALGLTFNF